LAISLCRIVIHGSTIATNALILRNAAKIGLILTHGHQDILTFREGGKEDPFFREIGGMVTTPVYRGDRLFSGAGITGLAIIREPTGTLVIFVGCAARVSQ
jgi:N-methylhydantoinase A/oxoprolinase/acetone carboxylase beta subunit